MSDAHAELARDLANRARDSNRRRDRRAAIGLFAIALALFLATMSGLPDNPDAEVEFQTARALAIRGAFDLAGTPEADAIVAREFDVAPGGPGRESLRYSWFGVGQAWVAVPFFVAGRAVAPFFPRIQAQHAQSSAYGARRSEYFEHLAVGLRNPLLGAGICAAVFCILRRVGACRRLAWWLALALALCTFLWPQARSTLSDVQATFALTVAFALLLRARDEIASSRRASAWASVGLGACLGLAVLTRVALAPAACVIALAFVVIAWRASDRARALSLAALPLLASAAAFVATNLARFGAPLETGYGHALREGTFFSYPMSLGLLGLLVAPGKGLAWMASLLALAPLGLLLAWRRGDRLVPIVVVAVALATLLPVACTQTWHGAYTYGPRYALPLVPIAWAGVGVALQDAWRHAALRVVALALALLGLATTLAGVGVDHMTHQDLAAQAARIEWPQAEGRDERERDDARFLSIQWDWRFAAPWAHWRILRERIGGSDERFPVRALFGVDSDQVVSPGGERERGFRHVAWIDLEQRLGGRAWPAWAACGALLVVGVALSLAARSRPGDA